MDRFIVASVQQRLRLPHTLDELRELQRRFLRAAQAKNARLVVFPELGGLMVAPPMLADVRTRLLKHADQGRRARATTWQRLSGRLAGGAASLLKASFASALAGLLDVEAGRLWQAYCEVYSDLAREFAVTVVAPSLYAPDPIDNAVRNVAAVFAPDGALLGTQAKLVLSSLDEGFCRAGSNWKPIRTEIGALGLMLGGDVLYPEAGRALAFQGAEMLIAQGASLSPTLYNKLRAGALARMQDNQLFAASAYLVGPNLLANSGDSPVNSAFIGRSAIFAPQELTPRFNGVLVEMGNQGSEGVLTAEWDFSALKQLWESSETPLRRDLPLPQVHKLLTALYEQVRAAPRLADGEAMEPGQPGAALVAAQTAEPLLSLDDLPVIASVTSRWPLPHLALDNRPVQEVVSEWRPPAPSGQPPAIVPLNPSPAADSDETDEMDALNGEQ